MWPRIAGSAASLPSRRSTTAARAPTSPHRRPSTMNGPRTNQFVAPTSFITSISRRREKIESRMVFAMRSTDAVEQDDHGHEEHDFDHTRDLEDPLRGLLTVLHALDAGELLRADRRGQLLDLLGARRRDLVRIGERIRGQVRRQLRIPLLHPLERLGARDELVVPDPVVRAKEGPDGVHLLRRHVLGEEHLHLKLLLHVVRPRHDPRAERDQKPEQEHPDQHGHGRRERRRHVRPDRPEGLGDDELEAAHHSVS